MNTQANKPQVSLPQEPQQLIQMLRTTQFRLQQAELRIQKLQQALHQAYAQLNKSNPKEFLAVLDSKDSPDPLSLSWEIGPENRALFPEKLPSSEKTPSQNSHTLQHEPDFMEPKQEPRSFPGGKQAYTSKASEEFAALASSNKAITPKPMEYKPKSPIPSSIPPLEDLSEETIESSLRELSVELKQVPTPAPFSFEGGDADPMATFCDPEAAKKHFDQLNALRAVFAAQQRAEAHTSSNKQKKQPSFGQMQVIQPPPLPAKRQSPPPPFARPHMEGAPSEFIETTSSPFEPMPQRMFPVDKTVDASPKDLLELLRK
ncbi:MAG: hypothetical protein H6728_04690 [Myxococcales bacterium]|nr:hypothetical protein [Myxococcales bacterium]MCB9642351.1 hypothetical protein [Myxococcales bacterium]